MNEFISKLPLEKSHELYHEDLIIGIDEAGRGPVLGSLIYSALFWSNKRQKEFETHQQFQDSKQVNEINREKAYQFIQENEHIGYICKNILPQVISKTMLKPYPISLNTLSYQAVADILLRIFNNNSNIIEIYIDTVGDPETYKRFLLSHLPEAFQNMKIIIEKKADANYKVVSASSIIAKVTRDKLLHDWQWEEDILLKNNFSHNYGSGYPGDETCVNWLVTSIQPVFGFPSIVRFSWSTAKEALIKSKAINVIFECDEDDNTQGSEEITSFFHSSGEKRTKRTQYFINKKMKHILPQDIHDLL